MIAAEEETCNIRSITKRNRIHAVCNNRCVHAVKPLALVGWELAVEKGGNKKDCIGIGVLAVEQLPTYTVKNGTARVGIKWGGLLISLLVHPVPAVPDHFYV